MSKWSESIYKRFNKYIESSLRGQTELDGVVDLGRQIIPSVDKYMTDLDTEENFVLPFFLPGGQQAEVMSPWDLATGVHTSLPFSTYTIMESAVYDMPWEKCGQLTYVFYHGETEKLLEIKEFLKDLCSREDWSAGDVNYFYRNDPTNPFDFKTVNMTNSSGPIPPESDGGRYGWLMSIYIAATYEGPDRTDDYSHSVNLGMI